MRYMIETTEEQFEIGKMLYDMQEEGKLRIIEKGDPLNMIRENLIKMNKALAYLKKNGIHTDIMIAYIRMKGVKKTDIDQVLRYQKEFLSKLGIQGL